MSDPVIDVLLVEDDPGDVLMTQEAFSLHHINNRLHIVSDGVEALQFLRREKDYRDAPRPSLVLLDLNLPRKDGREVLADIKSDPDLCEIAVVVLSTSSSRDDVRASYRSHANAYVTKPMDFQQFTDVVHEIDRFYGDIALLPL
ncbi:MAG TPA: response regulator [Micromonosporaceae bacterium]|jgi:two-component system response regulator